MRFNWLVRIVSWLLIIVALAACVSRPRLVYHTFGFDVLADSPHAELLDYRYGTLMQPVIKPPDWMLRSGGMRQQGGFSGEMIVADTLYAKWKIRTTGEVVEDTVNLKGKLPHDVAWHQIYFVIEARQLQVYLVSREPRSPDFPIVGPRKFRDVKVYAISP